MFLLSYSVGFVAIDPSGTEGGDSGKTLGSYSPSLVREISYIMYRQEWNFKPRSGLLIGARIATDTFTSKH